MKKFLSGLLSAMLISSSMIFPQAANAATVYGEFPCSSMDGVLEFDNAMNNLKIESDEDGAYLTKANQWGRPMFLLNPAITTDKVAIEFDFKGATKFGLPLSNGTLKTADQIVSYTVDPAALGTAEGWHRYSYVIDMTKKTAALFIDDGFKQNITELSKQTVWSGSKWFETKPTSQALSSISQITHITFDQYANTDMKLRNVSVKTYVEPLMVSNVLLEDTAGGLKESYSELTENLTGVAVVFNKDISNINAKLLNTTHNSEVEIKSIRYESNTAHVYAEPKDFELDCEYKIQITSAETTDGETLKSEYSYSFEMKILYQDSVLAEYPLDGPANNVTDHNGKTDVPYMKHTEEGKTGSYAYGGGDNYGYTRFLLPETIEYASLKITFEAKSESKITMYAADDKRSDMTLFSGFGQDKEWADYEVYVDLFRTDTGINSKTTLYENGVVMGEKNTEGNIQSVSSFALFSGWGTNRIAIDNLKIEYVSPKLFSTQFVGFGGEIASTSADLNDVMSRVELVFTNKISKPIEDLSVQDNTTGTAEDFIYDMNGNVLSIIPARGFFQRNHEYAITMSNGVTDVYGNTNRDPLQSRFTVSNGGAGYVMSLTDQNNGKAQIANLHPGDKVTLKLEYVNTTGIAENAVLTAVVRKSNTIVKLVQTEASINETGYSSLEFTIPDGGVEQIDCCLWEKNSRVPFIDSLVCR